MAWRDYIERLKKEYIGRMVWFEGQKYLIVKVDYNGIIHINKPSGRNLTTAVYMPHEARERLVR